MAKKTAAVIAVVKITSDEMTGGVRKVDKPSGAGGPDARTIPLHLARINAEVLLTVQGTAPTSIEFYSWIWALGMQGGPRLFSPNPGGIRLLFPRRENRYPHTVGDYAENDVVLSPHWLPALVSGRHSGRYSKFDPLERLVKLRLHAEVVGWSDSQLREDFGEDGPRVNHHWGSNLLDVVRITSPLFGFFAVWCG